MGLFEEPANYGAGTASSSDLNDLLFSSPTVSDLKSAKLEGKTAEKQSKHLKNAQEVNLDRNQFNDADTFKTDQITGTNQNIRLGDASGAYANAPESPSTIKWKEGREATPEELDAYRNSMMGRDDWQRNLQQLAPNGETTPIPWDGESQYDPNQTNWEQYNQTMDETEMGKLFSSNVDGHTGGTKSKRPIAQLYNEDGYSLQDSLVRGDNAVMQQGVTAPGYESTGDEQTMGDYDENGDPIISGATGDSGLVDRVGNIIQGAASRAVTTVGLPTIDMAVDFFSGAGEIVGADPKSLNKVFGDDNFDKTGNFTRYDYAMAHPDKVDEWFGYDSARSKDVMKKGAKALETLDGRDTWEAGKAAIFAAPELVGESIAYMMGVVRKGGFELFVANKNNENLEEIQKNNGGAEITMADRGQAMAGAIASVGIEKLSAKEVFGQGKVINSITNFIAKSTTKSKAANIAIAASRKFAAIGAGAAIEGSQEAMQGIIDAYTQKYGTEAAAELWNKEMQDELGGSFFAGAGSGGAITAGATVVNSVAERNQRKKLDSKIKELKVQDEKDFDKALSGAKSEGVLDNRVKHYKGIVNSKDSTPEEKKSAQGRINKIEKARPAVKAKAEKIKKDVIAEATEEAMTPNEDMEVVMSNGESDSILVENVRVNKTTGKIRAKVKVKGRVGPSQKIEMVDGQGIDEETGNVLFTMNDDFQTIVNEKYSEVINEGNVKVDDVNPGDNTGNVVVDEVNVGDNTANFRDKVVAVPTANVVVSKDMSDAQNVLLSSSDHTDSGGQVRVDMEATVVDAGNGSFEVAIEGDNAGNYKVDEKGMVQIDGGNYKIFDDQEVINYRDEAEIGSGDNEIFTDTDLSPVEKEAGKSSRQRPSGGRKIPKKKREKQKYSKKYLNDKVFETDIPYLTTANKKLLSDMKKTPANKKKNQKLIDKNNKEIERLQKEEGDNKGKFEKLKTAIGKATSFFSIDGTSNSRGIDKRLTDKVISSTADVESPPVSVDSYVLVASNEGSMGAEESATMEFVKSAYKDGARVFYFTNDTKNSASKDVIAELVKQDSDVFSETFYRQPDGSYSTNAPVVDKTRANITYALNAYAKEVDGTHYETNKGNTYRDLFRDMFDNEGRIADDKDGGHVLSIEERRKDSTVVHNEKERKFGRMILSQVIEDEDTKGFKKAKSPLYEIANLLQLGAKDFDEKKMAADAKTLSVSKDIAPSDLVNLRNTMLGFMDAAENTMFMKGSNKESGVFNLMFSEYTDPDTGDKTTMLNPKVLEIGLIAGISAIVQSKKRTAEDIANNEDGFIGKSDFSAEKLFEFGQAGAWEHTLSASIGSAIRGELGIKIKSNDSSTLSDKILTNRFDAEIGSAILIIMKESGVAKETKVAMTKKFDKKEATEKGNFVDIAEDFDHLVPVSNALYGMMKNTNKVVVPFSTVEESMKNSKNYIPNKLGYAYSKNSPTGKLQVIESNVAYRHNMPLIELIEKMGGNIEVALGAKTEAELERYSEKVRAKYQSNNDAIDRDIEGMKTFSREVDGKDTYFASTNQQSQGRVRHNGKEYNIQNSKLHRFTSIFPGVVEIFSKKSQVVMEDTIMFWMGVDIDKLDPTVLDAKAGEIFHGKKAQKGDNTDLLEMNEAADAVRRIDSGKPDEGDVELVNKFSAKHEGIGTLFALQEMNKYRDWLKTDMKSPFETNLVTEQDGRTNGLAINMMQFPADAFYGDNPENNLYGMTGINTQGTESVQMVRLKNGQTDAYLVVDRATREQIFGDKGAAGSMGVDTEAFLNDILGRDAVKELVMPGVYASGENSLNEGLADYIYNQMQELIFIPTNLEIGSAEYDAAAEKNIGIILSLIDNANANTALSTQLKSKDVSPADKIAYLQQYDFGFGVDSNKKMKKFLESTFTEPYVANFKKFFAPMFKSQEYMKDAAKTMFDGMDAMNITNAQVNVLLSALNSKAANDPKVKAALESQLRLLTPDIESFTVDMKGTFKDGTPEARLQELFTDENGNKEDFSESLVPLVKTSETENEKKTGLSKIVHYFKSTTQWGTVLNKTTNKASEYKARIRGNNVEDGSRGAPVSPIQSLDSAIMFVAAAIVAEKTGQEFNFTSIFDAMLTDLKDTDVVAKAYNEAFMLVNQTTNLSDNMFNSVIRHRNNAQNMINDPQSSEVKDKDGNVIVPALNPAAAGHLKTYVEKMNTWLNKQSNIDYNNKIKANRQHLFSNIQSIHQLGSYERGGNTGIYVNDQFVESTGVFQFDNIKDLGAVTKGNIEANIGKLSSDMQKKVNPDTGLLIGSEFTMNEMVQYLEVFHAGSQATKNIIAMSSVAGIKDMYADIEVELNSIGAFDKNTETTGDITVADGKGKIKISAARNEMFENIDYSTVLFHETLHPVIETMFNRDGSTFGRTFSEVKGITGRYRNMSTLMKKYDISDKDIFHGNQLLKDRTSLLMKHVTSKDVDLQKEAIVMMMGEPSVRRAFFNILGRVSDAEANSAEGRVGTDSLITRLVRSFKNMFKKLTNAMSKQIFSSDFDKDGKIKKTFGANSVDVVKMSDAYTQFVEDTDKAWNSFEKNQSVNKDAKLLDSNDGTYNWTGTAYDPTGGMARHFMNKLVDTGVYYYDKAVGTFTGDPDFVSNQTKKILGGHEHDNWVKGILFNTNSLKRMDSKLMDSITKDSGEFQAKATKADQELESALLEFVNRYKDTIDDVDVEMHKSILDTDLQSVYRLDPQLIDALLNGRKSPAEAADELKSQLNLNKETAEHAKRLANYMITHNTKINDLDKGDIILNVTVMNQKLGLKLDDAGLRQLDAYISLLALEQSGGMKTLKKMSTLDVKEIVGYAQVAFDHSKSIFEERNINEEQDQGYRRIKGWAPVQTEKDIEIKYAKSQTEVDALMSNPQEDWEVVDDFGKHGAILSRENLGPRFNQGVIPSQAEKMAGINADQIGIEAGRRLRKTSNLLPLYNQKGEIVAYRYVMNNENRVKHLGLKNKISKGIATMESTTIRRTAGYNIPQQIQKEIVQVGRKSADEFADSILNGEDVYPLMLNVQPGAFAKLPAEVRKMYKQIEHPNLLPKGLHAYKGKNPNGKTVDKTRITHVFASGYDSIIGSYEYNPDAYSRGMQRIFRMLKGFVRTFKNNVVVKSATVIAINMMAGVHLLALSGVPMFPTTDDEGNRFPGSIKIIYDSLKNAKRMLNIRTEMDKLEHKLLAITGKPGFDSRVKILKDRHDKLITEFKKNPLADVMERQFFQSMTGELITTENDTNYFENYIWEVMDGIGANVDRSEIAKQLKNSFMNKGTRLTTGVAGDMATLLGKIMPKDGDHSNYFLELGRDFERVMKANKDKPLDQIAEIFGREGSVVQKEGAFAMQMGDFMGRNAAYQWYVFQNTKPGMSKAEIEQVKDDGESQAQMDFVDYRKNLPRNVNFISSIIPIFPFAKFFLNIQPVLYNKMLENPVRFSVSAATAVFGIPGVSEHLPGGMNMLDTSVAFGFGGRVDPLPDFLSMAATPPAYIGEVWEAATLPYG